MLAPPASRPTSWAFPVSLSEPVRHVYVSGEGLQESAKAKTIRIGAPADQLVTDGPFAETKEQVGGFYVLECASIEDAIEWAKKVPARGGAIEVRPVMDYMQYGYEDPAVAQRAAT